MKKSLRCKVSHIDRCLIRSYHHNVVVSTAQTRFAVCIAEIPGAIEELLHGVIVPLESRMA